MFIADYRTVLEYSLRDSASGNIYIFISSFLFIFKTLQFWKKQIKQV